MRYDTIPPELFISNRQRLADLLLPNSLVILHSNDVMPTNADGSMPFCQNSDLLYLTGADQEESILIYYPEALDSAEREILFVRETSPTIAVWEGAKYTKEQAQTISGIQRIEWTDQFPQLSETLLAKADHIYLFAEEHPRSASLVETRNDRYRKQLEDKHPKLKFERLAPLMHQLRIIKSPIEVELIQKAASITEAGFRRVLGFLKPGIGEWELEAEFAHEFLRRRSKGFAYSPIVGSGANANVLHYLENNQICQDGDLVLMDVGAEWANWNSDMTRTIPVNGRFSERQRAVYEAVLRVMRYANSILRPGILPSQYQGAVLEFMEKELIALGLFSKQDAQQQDASKPLVKRYFMHGTSHHLGLDVHDVAPVDEPIAEGMVLTIEPGIYIQEESLGIRLENNVVIGKNENTDLMANIPIEIEDIEALMNQHQPSHSLH